MNEVVVLGAGGHAKVVISTLKAAGHSDVAVFADDEAQGAGEILGVPVRGTIAAAGGAGAGIIAIGSNATRKKISEQVNLGWLTLVHPAASVAPDVQLGEGTVVFAGAVVQPGCVIGRHVIINTGATIDHDCVIGDFAHVAPGVHLAGDVHVGEGGFLGIGCAVIPAKRSAHGRRSARALSSSATSVTTRWPTVFPPGPGRGRANGRPACQGASSSARASKPGGWRF